MKKIKAKNINMMQVFSENGDALPVTVLATESSFEDAGLAEGSLVSVSSISKGKGFQGVVKRHGFKGGRRTHGQKHSEREPGSISGSGGRAGGRVVKGMRMAGRMGADRITVKNLRIAKILPENKEIMLVGAVPGRRGANVEIRIP